jgi:3-methylfumaryl-CoA hydratase
LNYIQLNEHHSIFTERQWRDRLVQGGPLWGDDMSDFDHLRSWIGRTENAIEPVLAGAQASLAALLDHESPPWPSGELAPLAHWLHFLPRVRQSELGPDGHPARGGFLPPVPLPRRMWAGSVLRFHEPIPLSATMERRSRIADIAAKAGRSGALVFVKVRHEITVAGRLALEEQQDIVYRDMPDPNRPHRSTDPSAAIPQPADAAEFTREVTPNSMLLFRYSALTFNAHRIHYDLPYCQKLEGYPGLVVHGPLVATLLLDHFLRHDSRQRLRGFRFRAERPAFDTAPFRLYMARTAAGADLWATDTDGLETMRATVEAV